MACLSCELGNGSPLLFIFNLSLLSAALTIMFFMPLTILHFYAAILHGKNRKVRCFCNAIIKIIKFLTGTSCAYNPGSLLFSFWTVLWRGRCGLWKGNPPFAACYTGS